MGGSCPANQGVPLLRVMGAASAEGLLCKWVAVRKAENCFPQIAAASLLYRRRSSGSVHLPAFSQNNPNSCWNRSLAGGWKCVLTSPHQHRLVPFWNIPCFVQSGFKSVRLQAPSTSGLATFKVRKFSLTMNFSLPRWCYFIHNCILIN